MAGGRAISPSPADRSPARSDVPRPSSRRRTGRLASAGVILEAAATLFLRKGYAGTSMDEIAALARVSKQTIYTHFTDKERLFSDLILLNAERVDAFVEQVAAIFENADDIENVLLELARRYLGLVIRPEVLQLRRLVIGEAGRFPNLAETYYERVPERMLVTLASNLDQMAERGLLEIEDPMLAANHFVALILWVPLDRAMFFLGQETFVEKKLDQLAEAGVRTFLAAYGRPD
jgi:TetR/AcrR family transcriptional regulator, mexJK operon transcriptional repressor